MTNRTKFKYLKSVKPLQLQSGTIVNAATLHLNADAQNQWVHTISWHHDAPWHSLSCLPKPPTSMQWTELFLSQQDLFYNFSTMCTPWWPNATVLLDNNSKSITQRKWSQCIYSVARKATRRIYVIPYAAISSRAFLVLCLHQYAFFFTSSVRNVPTITLFIIINSDHGCSPF